MDQKHPIPKIKLPNIKSIILVASGKGGVGKSTVAAGMAMALAAEGYSVGLFDADIFGPSVPTLMNLQEAGRPVMISKEGKQVMEPYVRLGIKVMSIGFFFEPEQAAIWRGPMVSNVLKQLLTETDWGELDYLIVDTPPRYRRYTDHPPPGIFHRQCFGGHHPSIGSDCRCSEGNWHVTG